MPALDSLLGMCRWWIELLAAQSASPLIVSLVAIAGLRLFRVSAPAAVEAVRQWRFEPSILDGEPVAVRYILTIRFSLDDEEGRNTMTLVPSLDHPSPAATLHFGDQATFPDDTVERLSRLVDRVRLELPEGVRLTDAGMQDATLGLSGVAGPDGVETSVATFVQRLGLLPKIRDVDLNPLRRGDGGLYRFVVEAELDE
jgi:hypothetical protein